MADGARQPRLIVAAGLACAWLALVELSLVRARHGVDLADLSWLLLATLALTALLVGALALVVAALVRVRPVRRGLATLHARAPLRYGVGAVCLAGAAVGHWINATMYVRLYTSIHLALSIAMALAALVAFVVLTPPRVSAPSSTRRRWTFIGVAALVWALALGASSAQIIHSHRLRFVALEQTTLLWHELWAFDALTGALTPPEHASGEAVPDELLAPLRAAPPGAPSGIARGANLVLIVVDSLRADRVGPGLPALDALRAESIDFTRAYSPACATVRAMTSILTSRYPSQLDFSFVSVDSAFRFTPHARDSELVTNPLHGRKVHEVPLRDDHPTLAGLLAADGYQTATIPSYIYYLRGAGVVREFELVDEAAYREHAVDSMGITPVDLVARSQQFLAQRDRERPFFLWLHFMEPHAPYEARDDAARGGDAAARYDSELRHVDRQLARLFPLLPDDTVIAVIADHGEELGDHGGGFHGTTAYDEVARVPFLLRLPNRRSAAIDMPVGLLDLAPTVLDLLGVASDVPLMGRSLVPLIAGQPVVARPALVECMPPGRLVRALIAWPYKLIEDRELGTVQLYHLGRDQREQHNLVDREPDALAELRALLAAIESRVLRER